MILLSLSGRLAHLVFASCDRDEALFARGLLMPVYRFARVRWLCIGVVGSAMLAGVCGPILLAQQSGDALVKASGLIRSQQYDKAVAVAHGALATDPKNPKLWLVEAIAYSYQGDDAHALGDLNRALKLAPGLPQALQAKASILSRRHDKAVIPVLAEILLANPHDGTAMEMLALAKAQTGDCKAALALLAEVGTVASGHLESMQQKAACLLQTGAAAEAVPVLQQVMVLAPENAGARYDLAVALLDAGRAKDAAATLEPLLQNTRDVDTLLLGADVAEANGDTPTSAGLLRRAIVADPQRANSYVRFAELCMSHESYEAGIDMVTAGLLRLPKEPTLYLARGLLLGGLAQYDKAEADFLQAERYDPQHGTGAYAVGVIEMQSNKPEQALQDVRAGLKRYPDDAQLNFLLARVLLERGAKPNSPVYAEAERSAEKAVKLKPNLVQARDLLAKIYQETGRPANAVVQCRAALAIDPDDGQALYRLMRSLRATGNTDEAQQVARKVTEQHDRERSEETDRLRFKIRTSSPAGAGTPAPH